MLDAPPAAMIDIAQPVRDADLQIEGQLVHGAVRDQMQLIAHGPKKSLGFLKLVELCLGKHS